MLKRLFTKSQEFETSMKFDIIQIERMQGGWIMGPPKADKCYWSVYTSFDQLTADLAKFMTEDQVIQKNELDPSSD